MSTLTEVFSDIADSIRTKNGTNNTYTPAQMPDAIEAIDTVNNQNKTVSPTTSSQTVTADSGYTGLGTVTVNAMPTTTHPNPTISVNTSTGVVTASHAQTAGYVSAGTTTQTRQLLTNAGGTYSASDLDNFVGPVILLAQGTMLTGNLSVGSTDGFVSSSIARKSSSDLTASGATVTVPAGYYESQASKSVTTMTLPTSATSSATSGYTSKATISRSTSDQYINIPAGYNSAGGYYKVNAVANGSATAPASISGSSATVSTGTNTLTLTKTVSVTPSVTAGYVSSGTAGNSSVSLTASVTTKAAATITPGTSNQTIASGTYLTGTQTISGDSDLTAANIKQGVQIFNVTGSYTSDATAAAGDIVSGQTAYVNGSKITGNLVINKYYTGSSAPSSSLGSNGDIYFQS